MAVSIVGTTSAVLSGGSSVNISLPGGTAIGDNVYLHVSFKRAGGANTSCTDPSGYETKLNLAAFRLCAFEYTSTPPANETVTFGDTDVHAEVRAVAVRGYLANGT